MANEIVAKRYGLNLVVMIEGRKITRVIKTDKDKEDEVLIKNKILLYNKRNNKNLLQEIINLVDTRKAEVEKQEAEKKGLKKAIKKETKKEKVSKKVKEEKVNLIDELEKTELSKEDTARLEALLNKTKSTQKKEEVKPVVAATKRTGEW